MSKYLPWEDTQWVLLLLSYVVINKGQGNKKLCSIAEKYLESE